MTEKEFLDLITSKSAAAVLNDLAKMPTKERRAFAKPAMKLFKELDRFWIQAESLPRPDVKDGEAVTVAVLATASGSELKKMSFFPRPGKVELVGIVEKLKPDWVQAVCDHFVEQRVIYVDLFRPLWEASFCERPASDAVILEYYSHWSWRRATSEAALLGGDVWRFFEVEGGGEDSLANHDKFVKRGVETWADRLKRYSEEGKLDRQRLLDASLDALDRDFAQYRAGWYSRFHVLMAPGPDEMAARSTRYLRLLSSSIPPTVSFAMKHVQALDKADVLDPADLIAALEPALQARAKGTVTAALGLLRSAAKKRPALCGAAARVAVSALISEDAGVQSKALDAIEALGVETVVGDLAGYVDLVAPSVQPRIAAMAGVKAEQTAHVTLEIAPSTAAPVAPVASADEALALFLRVLEAPRDPFEVELAVDGVSRFGAALRADDAVLSPLRKRAKQVCNSPGDSDLRYLLALTGRALADGTDLLTILAEESGGKYKNQFFTGPQVQEVHLRRNIAVIDRVLRGVNLPMLSLPSETSGLVLVSDLLARLDQYLNGGETPDANDIALALMRVDPKGRDGKAPGGDTEAERVVAYAFGRRVEVGPTPDLWAAAWCARGENVEDKAIAKLFKKPTPNCGIPARLELEVKQGRSANGEYTWVDVDVHTTPANELRSHALPALFGLINAHYNDATCCGFSFADIAWASLTRPADPEQFFRVAIIHQDTWQKLSDNHTRAYLEPFFRPGPTVGPLGAAVLAYYMACEDKSVSSLAVEAAGMTAAEGRLTADAFVDALKPFLMSHDLPTSRWTKALKGMSDLGAGAFAREVIVGLLDFAPGDTPRDIGGLLELCYELHVAQDARLEIPTAVSCLASIPGGGKTAKFAKKLLALAA